MIPDGYLSLDETIYPSSVGTPKNKLPKYGLLFRRINNTEISFTYSAVLDSGKPVGQANKHCLTSTDDIVKYLVTISSNCVNVQGFNISCD